MPVDRKRVDTTTRAWVSQSAFRAKPTKRKYIGLHCDRDCGSFTRAARNSGVIEVPRQFWCEFQPCSSCALLHLEWRWYPSVDTSTALRDWWARRGEVRDDG